LNNILCVGDNLYTFISRSINKSYLLLTDVPEMVSIFDRTYHLEYSDPLAGDLFMETTSDPYYTLEDALSSPFSDLQLNYQHCLLTINANTVAVFKTSGENFKIFDSHARDLYGMPHQLGKCVLLSVEGITNLVVYFQNTIPRNPGMHMIPFEVKGVIVSLPNCEMEKDTVMSSMQNSENASAEQTVLEKQNKLEKSRNYQRKKRACETESERQVRLENARKYHNLKRTEETEIERQIRLEKDREYSKRKRAETVAEKQSQSENSKQSRKNKTATMSQENYLKEFDTNKNGSIQEQSWAKANITNFYKSIQLYISQCKICHEAWPLKSKTRLPSDYVCLRCSRDKKSPQKFSVENSMIPSPIPQQLQGLTQVEEMLLLVLSQSCEFILNLVDNEVTQDIVLTCHKM
jgi:flagellar biosynthesis GTPase FlhF